MHRQVFFFFWACRLGSGTPVPLAFVKFYTTEGTGRIDNTGLTRLCWELDTRPPASTFPGLQPVYNVVSTDLLIKLEHIVPMWHDTSKEMFYVNKFASFSYMLIDS